MTDIDAPASAQDAPETVRRDLISHPKCGRSWSGLTRSHCPVCCETFSCDSAADRHRKGSFGVDRRCVDPATVGLVAVEKPWGRMWQNPGPAGGFGSRRDDH